MSYYIRSSNRTRGKYLQIYESFRDPFSHQPRGRCIKTLGYVCDLISDSIPDPLSYYQNEVEKYNAESRNERYRAKAAKIASASPERYLGCFPLSAILKHLGIRPLIDLLQTGRNFKYSVFEVIQTLACARAVKPCSKLKTCFEVIPALWAHPDVSYDQILECLDFIGNDYHKFVELFTVCVSETYILDTEKVFFDCTNYYFEIDQEDDWRRKGPSKENRKDPIMGMGLLLDKNCIPLGMELYPGNQSEKPVIREAINNLKKRQGITGRTIQIADKGLNCAKNIIEALERADGYLFSRSVKKLEKKEQEWVFKEKDPSWKRIVDEKGNTKYWCKSCIDEFSYSCMGEDKRRQKRTVKEKRLVIYNEALAKKQREEARKLADKARHLCYSQAKKNEYGESSRYVEFVGEKEEKAKAVFREDKLEEDLRKCGYNMLVTSERAMSDQEMYNTYHRLWRIEETFRALKSELEARPVFMQTVSRIKGHFLICYITVLLERLFQFKVLENKFGTEEIFEFIRSFRVVGIDSNYAINLAPDRPLINFLADKYNIPITNARLSKSQIKKVLECEF